MRRLLLPVLVVLATGAAATPGHAASGGASPDRVGGAELPRFTALTAGALRHVPARAAHAARAARRGKKRRRARSRSPRRTARPAARYVRQDVSGDGIADVLYDLDGDGRYELVLIDADRSGRFEWAHVDTASVSGVFRDADEVEALELGGPDGLADTWVSTRVSSGDVRQDRAASDLMTRHIVSMNQARQLDPWSTGYIRYNPAPSLLR
jgi:hypothetical protein